MTRPATNVVALWIAAFVLAGSGGAIPSWAAGPACDEWGYAGSWLNSEAVEGSDVIAAEIRVDCRRPVPRGEGPKVQIALTVRCLHYECVWRPVAGQWGEAAEGGTPTLAAVIDEERVERRILVEAPERGSLRMTVTTRFRTVPLEPRQVTYRLKRQK